MWGRFYTVSMKDIWLPGFLLWAAAFVLLLTPLPRYDIHFFAGGFCALLLAVVLSLLRHKGAERPVLTWAPLPLFLAVFVCASFISAAASAITLTAFLQACFLCVLPLGFWFFLLQQNKATFFNSCSMFVFILTSGLAAFSILQYVFWPENLLLRQAHYPFADPNAFAAFLSLAWFCLLGHAAQEPQQKRRLIYAFMLLLMGFCLTLTGSRAAMLSLTLWVGVFAVMTGRIRPFLFYAALAVSAAAGLAFLLLYPAPEWLAHRLQIWAGTFQIIATHSFIGTGPGTFFLYYPEMRGDDFSTTGQMAHNDPLQLWAEIGMIVPLCFYGVVVALALMWRKAKVFLDQADKSKIAGILCGLGALTLHAHVNFNFYTLPILFCAGTLLGSAYSLLQPYCSSRKTELPFSWASLQVICGAALVLITFVFLAFQGSEIILRHARTYLEQGDIETFVQQAERAQKLSLGLNSLAYAQEGAALSMGLRLQVPASQNPEVTAKHADSLLIKSLQLNPRLASAHHERALLHWHLQQKNAETDDFDIGTAFERALALDPASPGVRIDMSLWLLQQGRAAEALSILKRGLDYKYPGRQGGQLFLMARDLAEAAGDQDTKARANALYQTLQYLNAIEQTP
jgi:O-antigen ligase